MEEDKLTLIYPNWSAPKNIHAFTTTRSGGFSQPPFDTFNMGSRTGDPDVAKNRLRLSVSKNLPSNPYWLIQTHSTTVLDISEITPIVGTVEPNIEADGAYTTQSNQVCVILTADCLPLLFCSRSGDEVAATHAGWRGLCNGILEETVAKFKSPKSDLIIWLGPAIGPTKFEVGEEVKAQFMKVNPKAKEAFTLLNTQQNSSEKKYLADLYLLATQRLNAVGVNEIYSSNHCTYSEDDQFYSYRRNPQTGRMASMIWFE